MKIKPFYKVATIFLCLAIAGPEFGVGLELIVLVDGFGFELILLTLTGSLWNYWNYAKSKLEEIDPYFFLSSPKDILSCPALLAHAIPGSMSLFMFLLTFTAVAI